MALGSLPVEVVAPAKPSIVHVTRVLTPQEIATLFSAPVFLVAGRANHLIVPIVANFRKVQNGTAYAAGSTPWTFRYATSLATVFSVSMQPNLTNGATSSFGVGTAIGSTLLSGPTASDFMGSDLVLRGAADIALQPAGPNVAVSFSYVIMPM